MPANVMVSVLGRWQLGFLGSDEIISHLLVLAPHISVSFCAAEDPVPTRYKYGIKRGSL